MPSTRSTMMSVLMVAEGCRKNYERGGSMVLANEEYVDIWMKWGSSLFIQALT
nr:hypothetical protein [Acetobacterium bakii]